ncbi:lactonase family protein [Burkholderia perseverans]|uniref:lactonase family protein n=1 Tax=Burkholderia perseverans TaxID=2615214 RepID=UPI001FEE0B4A|nr:lactonase family protein [Burkholderia perseverans]
MAPALKPAPFSRLARCAAAAWASIAAASCTLPPAGQAPGAAASEFAYVGTLDARIDAVRLDLDTGRLVALGTVARGPRSTWVEAHPALPVLYAVDDDRDREGSVTAYAVNRASGAIAPLDTVQTGGRGTTFLRFDLPSLTLLGANYDSGSVSSLAVKRDGGIGPLVSTLAETGAGPGPRQKSAHAHGITLDPSGRYALVPDLGADRVFIDCFDRATHRLSPCAAGAPPAFATPPGSGPRRLVFGPDGRHAYLLTELGAQVMVLRWDAVRATLTPIQTESITTASFDGTKSGAEMALGRDGRFLYVENRAEDALLVYGVDAGSGRLTLLQRVASGGRKPWGFGIDAAGRWMLVANRLSGNLRLFRIDPATGLLADSGASVDVKDPTSVAFVR